MTKMARFLFGSTNRLCTKAKPPWAPSFSVARRMSYAALACRTNEQHRDHQWTRGVLATGLLLSASMALSSNGHTKTQNEGPQEKGSEKGANTLATSHTGMIPNGLHAPGLTPLITVSSNNNKRSDTGTTKFQVLKSLEVKQEGEKVRLAKFLRELHDLANENAKEDKQKSLTHLTRRYSTRALKATLSVNSKNLKNLTPELARKLVAGLNREELLDKKSLIKLIDRAVEVLKQEETLVDLRSRSNSRFTVVGDLHGSLKCLQRVLDIVGDLGDPDNSVVFAGDFVDRGENSLEVFFTLLLYKLAYPKNVILLRGNHEDTMIASVYGFCDEIHSKYGKRRGAQIFRAMSDLFAALPVCAVTENAFLVHGGLPHDHFSIEQVAAIAAKSRSAMHTVMESRNEEEKLLESLLWSDPSIYDGVAENPRGCGIEFGPDIAKQFLDNEGLTYIIRGHEPAENGTQVMDVGDGKAVVTVFSTANYPNGEGANLGAVVQVDHEGNAQSVEFSYAGSPTDDKPEKVLQSFMIENRDKLIQAFTDVQRNHRVTAKQWVHVMKDTLQIPDIPWDQLQPTLAPTVEETILIDWKYHLDRVAPVLSNSLDNEQMNILRANKEQVRRVFELLDADGNGGIDKNEFFLGVEMLNKKLLPPDKQIEDHEALFNALDLDGNGEIDIDEFNEGMAQSAAVEHISASLDKKQVATLKENSEMLLAVFKFLDTDGSGSIDRSEFRTGIKLLNKRLPPESRFKDSDKLFDALDVDGSGDIDISEFNQVFQLA